MPGTNFYAKDPVTGNFIALTDENGLPVLVRGTTVPTSGSFSKGCLFIKTDAATGVKSLYENQGTTSAPVFNVVGDVSLAELSNPNSLMVVQAHKSSVAVNQADAEIYEYTAPAALTVVGVQVYCTATAATASVEVKEAGTTILSSAVTPSAGAVVAGTVSDSAIASGAALTVHVTTNGTGTITDLMVTLTVKAAHQS